MLKSSEWVTAAAALSFLVEFAGGAHAATASATISNVYVQVLNLDPPGGAVPGMVFDYSKASVFAQATADNGMTWFTNENSGPLGATLAPVLSSAGGASSTASVSAGDVFTLGHGPGGTIQASATGQPTQALVNTSPLFAYFTLPAHSQLVISADTSGVAATGVLGEQGYVYAQVSLRSFSSDPHAQVSEDASYVWLESDGKSYSNLSPRVTASFFNLSDAPSSGYAVAEAYAYLYLNAAVPEPPSVAMFFGGLLVIGGVAARNLRC